MKYLKNEGNLKDRARIEYLESALEEQRRILEKLTKESETADSNQDDVDMQ